MHVRDDQQHPRYACHSAETSRKLQRKLYTAAKRSRNRRFHALYDRIYRPDVLWRAWTEVKTNGGSAGVDGATFADIEDDGVEEFLFSIEKDLRDKHYRPSPVLRVNIPKPDGSLRPLGIPTIRDRVAQQACRIVIEPIFEANFQDNSYGFRPKRSAADAAGEVESLLVRNWWVVDADIQKYFDTIDHDLLMSLLKRRISDRRVLKLVRQWLKAGVVEDGNFRPTNTGSPQGGVISPLLANIYLHPFDLYWNTGWSHLGRLIRYADDRAPRRGMEVYKMFTSMRTCCTEDEGGPLEVALQEEASNHPELLWPKSMVVSVRTKGRPGVCQVCIEETNTSEPLIKCRKRRNVIKTGGESLTRDKFGGYLHTVRAVTGMEAA